MESEYDDESRMISMGEGEYDNETGQYYYRARMYSPQQARFLSNDPMGMIDGPNMYAYVRNDPINARDPSGWMSGFWYSRALINGGGSAEYYGPDYDTCPNAGYDSYWECFNKWTRIGSPPPGSYTSIEEACSYYCYGSFHWEGTGIGFGYELGPTGKCILRNLGISIMGNPAEYIICVGALAACIVGGVLTSGAGLITCLGAKGAIAACTVAGIELASAIGPCLV